MKRLLYTPEGDVEVTEVKKSGEYSYVIWNEWSTDETCLTGCEAWVLTKKLRDKADEAVRTH